MEKEQLLEDVPTRTRLREGVLRCGRLVGAGLSESEEFDVGGEGALTRSYGLRVRNIGALVSIALVCAPCMVALGRVSLQLSQGADFFLSFSSYVLLKLELRLLMPKSANLGLSGGVSAAEAAREATDATDAMDVSTAVTSLALLSAAIAVFRFAPRVTAASPSAGFSDLELLGRRAPTPWLSKHDVQPTGKPSVTISGVGP